MPELIGLDGFKGKAEVKVFCKSVSQFIIELKKKRFAAGANDYGAITVWKRTDGKYRAQRCVRQFPSDSIETNSVNQVRIWLKKNYPLIVNG